MVKDHYCIPIDNVILSCMVSSWIIIIIIIIKIIIIIIIIMKLYFKWPLI